MTDTSDNMTSRYVRGFVSLVGIVTALVGVVTRIDGWQHGHSLITLGLLVVIILEYDWKVGPHRALAFANALEARKRELRGVELTEQQNTDAD